VRFLRLFFLIVVLVGCSKSSIYNNHGVLELYFEKYDSAKTAFLKSLVFEPGSVYTRYNLSLVSLKQENLVAADKELKFLEKQIWNAKDYKNKSSDLFRVFFAQAFIKTMLKEVPKALAKYQDCLSLDPNSRDVKKNIELLMASQQGESGQQGKDKSSKSDSKKGDKDSKDKKEGGDQDENDEGKGKDKSDEDIKGRDDSSLERKKMSEKERAQILKEIKNQESRIRSQENSKYKGEGSSGKTW